MDQLRVAFVNLVMVSPYCIAALFLLLDFTAEDDTRFCYIFWVAFSIYRLILILTLFVCDS